VSAFLRGIQRRATLLARLQCGDPRRAATAVAQAARRFTELVGDRPMEQWPVHYWGLLMADPALRGIDADAFWPRDQAWLGNLSAGVRATVLLRLVAGLQLDGIAAALHVPEDTAHRALRAALPRDEDGHHDAAAWQARQAALRAALDEMVPSGTVEPAPARSRPGQTIPLLWAGVGACVLALAATLLPFQRPGGAAIDGIATGTPLPPSEAPAVALAPGQLLLAHPDLAQIADARDADVVRDLGFHGWYAAQRSATASEQAQPRPGVARATAPESAEARARWLQAMPASRREALLARAETWDALPAAERATLREHWAAWQLMPLDRQALVRAAASAFSALPAGERQALRDEFAGLPASARRGWLLGPVVGAEWTGLEPLLMQVPADERKPLLAVLHAMPAAQLRDLAILSQRTPPQGRDDLRSGLIRTSAAQRAGWLQARLRQ
jgi:hypothetical protein